MYTHRSPAVLARLLLSVTAVVDVEPDDTFADATVITAGEELMNRIQSRAHAAGIRPVAGCVERTGAVICPACGRLRR